MFNVAMLSVAMFSVAMFPLKSASAKLTNNKDITPDDTELTEEEKAKKSKGIILAFKHWPLKKNEKQEILRRVEVHKFKKNTELFFLKTWIFEWDKLQDIDKVLKVCEEFSSIAYLRYCEPDFLVPLDGDGSLRNLKPIPKVASFAIHPKPIIDKAKKNNKEDFSRSETGNLKTCGIISTKYNLEYGTLSDYWAQEMIGSDLSKEELKKEAPVTKNLVAVWDSPKNQHDVAVTNLISHEGKQAVLPDLKNKITNTTTKFGSDFQKTANGLLDKANNQCSNLNSGSESPSFSGNRP